MAEVVAQGNTKDGKGLSITSMVLGICSLVLVVWLGFILGIMAIIFAAIGLKRKKNGFAIAGLVTGIIGTVISIFIGFLLIIAIYAGIQQAANDSSVETTAATVQQRAEYYNTAHNSYPSFEQMQADLADFDSSIVIDRQGYGTGGDIIYIPCYGDGAIIWYWSGADEEYKTYYAGETYACEWND